MHARRKVTCALLTAGLVGSLLAGTAGPGALDKRLFDVTALAGYGYDSRRGDLPLIVQHGRTARTAARAALARGSARVTPSWPAWDGPPGTSFSMPATIAAQPDSLASGLNTVTVQYSTNDGATWSNATVTGSGATRTVTVTHPDTTGFVSIRATATDFAGNAVQQTVIRAYRIAP